MVDTWQPSKGVLFFYFKYKGRWRQLGFFEREVEATRFFLERGEAASVFFWEQAARVFLVRQLGFFEREEGQLAFFLGVTLEKLGD